MASALIPDVDQGGGLPVSVPDLEAPVMVPADRVDPEMDPAAEGPGAVRDQEGREAEGRAPEAWAAATMAAVRAVTVMAQVDVAERPSSRAQKTGGVQPPPASVSFAACTLQSCDLGHDIAVFDLPGNIVEGSACLQSLRRSTPALPGLHIAFA